LERHSSGFVAGDGNPALRYAYECRRPRNDRPCAEVGPAAPRDHMLERLRDLIDAPERLRLSAPFLAQRSRLSWMLHVVDRVVGRHTGEERVSHRGRVVCEIFDRGLDDLLKVAPQVFHEMLSNYAI